RHLERIVAASGRAAALVNDLLDITRVRLSGEMLPIDPQPADLASIVGQVVEEFRLAHGEHRVIYTDGARATGTFDGARIGQVVANLLRNAIQHGNEGEPVEVRIHTSAGEVEISVRNEGPPIPEAQRPHLFDP